MRRGILGVVGGLGVWSCLWFGMHLALPWLFPKQFNPDGSTEHFVINLLVVLLSFDFSFISGYVNAIIAKNHLKRFALWQAAVQFTIAAGTQAMNWPSRPVWFHAAFLGFIFPAVMAGALYKSANDEQEFS
jgi:hypothetical protein